jgi:hypothetical protein
MCTQKTREGDSAVKKTLSDLALPLHVADEFLMFLSCQFNSVYHKLNIIIIIDKNYNKNIPLSRVVSGTK